MGCKLHVMLDLSHLEALIARLAAADFSQSSEQDAREMAVNPIIGALGWNTFDRAEVFREFSVRGGRVDYCLRRQRRNLVLIEVKRVGTELGEHQEQLLRYAFDEGVPLAALTDGLVWWLYLPMAGGSWEQRRFFCVSFREQESGNAASAIHRFLNCEDVASGAALEEAKREFESQERGRRTRAALQEAWQRILEDPHGLLRDLLAEAVQEITGHLPDPDTISEFLRGLTEAEAWKTRRLVRRWIATSGVPGRTMGVPVKQNACFGRNRNGLCRSGAVPQDESEKQQRR